MKKLEYVDSLRGIAVLAVILFHSNQIGRHLLAPEILNKISSSGIYGVQLFFLTSAFTLYISFNTRYKNEINPVRNFFIRRFFRIAPMYYLAIFYYLLQDGFGPRYWLGDKTEITISNIISNFTFTHGFNPYWVNSLVPGGWSIAIEMIFYALLPILFLRIKNINQAFNFFILSLVIKLVVTYFFIKYPLIGNEQFWNGYLFFYFPRQLPIFSLGILLYFVVIVKQELSKISANSVLALCVLAYLQLVTNSNLIFERHVIFGLVFFLFAVSISRYNSFLFVNRVITFIGKISFSMYLVHFAVLHWLNYFKLDVVSEIGTVNYFLKFFIVVIISILISTFLYKIVEVPFQSFGKKIILKLEKKHQHISKNKSNEI